MAIPPEVKTLAAIILFLGAVDLAGRATGGEKALPFSTLHELRRLDYNEFEERVAEAWENRGYETELTERGADKGIDVVAEDGDETVVILAERHKYDNRVGKPTIKDAVAAVGRYGSNRAVVATSSSFTEPAEKYADMKDRVRLVDGEQLAEWL